MVSWDYQAEYQEEHNNPSHIDIEEGTDLGGYHLTAVDRMILSLYGDHVHRNNGTHLDGGVVGDRMWQQH